MKVVLLMVLGVTLCFLGLLFIASKILGGGLLFLASGVLLILKYCGPWSEWYRKTEQDWRKVPFLSGFSPSELREKKRLEIERSFDDVDRMDGYRFEQFVADVLRVNDFRDVTVTKASGDYGVDITASKEKQSYAFQCKCYQSTLGLKPIQEVYSGAKKYGADRAVVVTNSYFSKNAKVLALDLSVQLWDRDVLAEMIWKKKRREETGAVPAAEVLKTETDAGFKRPERDEKENDRMETVGMATRIGAGKYVFGEDLPVGKYDLNAVFGSGSLHIQKSDQKDDDGEYPEKYIYLSEDPKRGASGYRGLSLPGGWYFSLDSNVVVEITKSKMLEIE